MEYLEGKHHPGEGACEEYDQKGFVTQKPYLSQDYPEFEGWNEHIVEGIPKKDEHVAKRPRF